MRVGGAILEARPSGGEIVTVSDCGLEGGIVATIVITIGIGAVLAIASGRQR